MEPVTGLSRRGLLILTAAVVIGVVASTVVTSLSTGGKPGCPDRAFGCATFEEGEAVVLGVLSSRPEVRLAVRLAAELRGNRLKGRILRVAAWDDRCSAEGAARAARQLATDPPDGPPVVAVVGESCSSAITPAAQILSDSGITLASVSATRLPATAGSPRFYVTLGPMRHELLEAFDAAYAQRVGPPTAEAIRAAFAADLLLRATEDLAVIRADGDLLVPRTPLRDELLAAGFVRPA